MTAQASTDGPYVFLSYASADRERALALADALERHGIRVWLDRTSIAGGTSWGSEIVEGIERCTALLILCTAAAMQSRNVRQEIQLAWRYERAYVPLLLEPLEFPQQVLYFLEGYQWVEVLDQPEAVWLPVLLKALGRVGIAAQLPAATGAPRVAPTADVAVATRAAPQQNERRSTAAERRRALVGRATELGTLRTALAQATGGEGRLVLLVGEPGIGKTRLAQELAAEAGQQGCLVLWGRCWEVEGAPAFWPWVQLLGSYARGQEPHQVQRALGPAAADIAQLVPEVRALLPDLPPPPPTEPEAARFRLFGGITAFLTGLALGRPLVLILDDLHWADKPSLLLLQFLAKELLGSRILVLGTYRDTDLDRRHPLDEALTALRREPVFERIALGGLSEAEVLALMEARAGHPLDADGRALAAAIHRETEGNPFFVGETLRHLADSGRIAQRDGRWQVMAASVAELDIPEGVRQVIGRRLSRLAEATNALLSVAAVIGREFDVRTLEWAGGLGADAVDAALDEASAAQLITQAARTAGRYRFAHALVRETLYQELPARRRLRLHQRVGEALAQAYGARAEAHAAELAYHYTEAAGGGAEVAARALAYHRVAAEQAEAATAWEAAARHYEQCLSLMADAGEDLGADEAALLTALGRCLRAAGEYRAAWRSLMQAIDRARAAGDGVGLARATLEATDILTDPARYPPLVDAALAALGDRDPHLEALLHVQRTGFSTPDNTDEDRAHLARARALAERHDFDDVRFRLAYWDAEDAIRELRFNDALALWRTLAERARRSGDSVRLAGMLTRHAMTMWYVLDLTAAEAAAREALAELRPLHVEMPIENTANRLSGLHLARCEDAAFEALLAELHPNSYPKALQRAARAERAGDLAGALALLPTPELGGGFPVFVAHIHAGRARVRLNAGDAEGARREFAAAVEALTRIPVPGRFNYGRLFILTEMDEALVALADDALARSIYEEISGWTGVMIDPLTPRALPRLRASLALRLGELDAAERDFGATLAWAEAGRLPIEAGRCLQGLAEVAARRGWRAEARASLDRAAARFEQHGALLYLRQVQEARAALPA